MRNWHVFIVVFLFISSLKAQKVKLEDVKVPVKYQEIPNVGFKQGITIYEIEILGKESFYEGAGLSKNGIRSKLEIPAYHRVETGGEIIIKVTLGPVQFSSWKDSSSKNKNNKTLYYTGLEYSNNYSYEVLDSEGVVLHSQTFLPSRSSWNSNSFNSIAARTKWKKENKGKYWELRKEMLESNIGKLRNSLQLNFGLKNYRRKGKIQNLKREETS